MLIMWPMPALPPALLVTLETPTARTAKLVLMASMLITWPMPALPPALLVTLETLPPRTVKLAVETPRTLIMKPMPVWLSVQLDQPPRVAMETTRMTAMLVLMASMLIMWPMPALPPALLVMLETPTPRTAKLVLMASMLITWPMPALPPALLVTLETLPARTAKLVLMAS